MLRNGRVFLSTLESALQIGCSVTRLSRRVKAQCTPRSARTVGSVRGEFPRVGSALQSCYKAIRERSPPTVTHVGGRGQGRGPVALHRLARHQRQPQLRSGGARGGPAGHRRHRLRPQPRGPLAGRPRFRHTRPGGFGGGRRRDGKRGRRTGCSLRNRQSSAGNTQSKRHCHDPDHRNAPETQP